jgi:tetratricopeptide (TPR) repeat protein
MRREDTVRLNGPAVAKRVAELEIKQWWLARMIGVDRKTVSRWLTGKVKRIARENARRLAEHLQCDVEDLTVSDEADVLATREEQRRAATLLQERDLLQLLSPSDDFALAERLIKAVLQPDLPLPDLGRLYNLLSVAAWRQGHYDEGRAHAERAREIARRAGDRTIEWRARLSLATVASFVGDPAEATAEYERCVARPENFGSERDRAGTHTNLAMVYREAGRLEEALGQQWLSIRAFEPLGLPFNLALAWTGLGIIRIERGDLAEAREAMTEARTLGTAAGAARVVVTADVYLAEIASLEGETLEARRRLDEAFPALTAFEVHDLGCDEAAVRILRRAGDLEAARERFETAHEAARPLPVLHGLLLMERARLALAEEDEDGESRWRRRANEVFTDLGLMRRVRRTPVVEQGRMFRTGGSPA